MKIQRPLYTSGSYLDVYIYNEDRSIEDIVPMDAKDIETLFGYQPKVYAEGKIDRKGKFHVIKIVPEQEW